MGLKQQIIELHKILEAAKIEHALIGGIALGFHGVQRNTDDIDFIVKGEDKTSLELIMKSAGYLLEYSSENVLQYSGPANVDFLLANKPLSLAMIANAFLIESLKVKCLRAEDIIGLKIQAFCNDKSREFQDKADILRLIETNQKLDFNKIKQYADLFNVWPIIEEMRKRK